MDAPEILKLVAIPVTTALTGYVTNYIAVRMLFRPRSERRWLGLRVQGLIPRRRRQIARKVAETVARHLVSHDDIRRAVEDPEAVETLRKELDRRVESVLRKKLKDAGAFVSMFASEGMLFKVKAHIMMEMMAAIPPMTEDLLSRLEEKIDFKQIVIDRIEAFDLDRFEEIVMDIASRELRAIEVLGAVFGLIIGLITDGFLLL